MAEGITYGALPLADIHLVRGMSFAEFISLEHTASGTEFRASDNESKAARRPDIEALRFLDQTGFIGSGLASRNTVHFSANTLVADHAYGSFDRNIIAIAPLAANLQPSGPSSFSEVDVVFPFRDGVHTFKGMEFLVHEDYADAVSSLPNAPAFTTFKDGQADDAVRAYLADRGVVMEKPGMTAWSGRDLQTAHAEGAAFTAQLAKQSGHPIAADRHANTVEGEAEGALAHFASSARSLFEGEIYYSDDTGAENPNINRVHVAQARLREIAERAQHPDTAAYVGRMAGQAAQVVYNAALFAEARANLRLTPVDMMAEATTRLIEMAPAICHEALVPRLQAFKAVASHLSSLADERDPKERARTIDVISEFARSNPSYTSELSKRAPSIWLEVQADWARQHGLPLPVVQPTAPAQTFDRWKSYYYAGTDVLINKPGLRDAKALKTFEYENAFVRTLELARAPIPGKFDLDHLQAIHKHLLQDTYEWAGHLRDVGLSKAHTNFVEPAEIRREADRIHKNLEAAGYFEGSDKPKFAAQLAEHYGRLNRLHPFREGNGRATREYLGQLAQRAGFVLDQQRIEADKPAWNAAAAKAAIGDASGIEKIFSEAVRPSRAVAFEVLPREEALKRHPELASAYAMLDHKVDGIKRRYAGNEKAQVHFIAHQAHEIVRSLDSGKLVAAVANQVAVPGSHGHQTATVPPQQPFLLARAIEFAEKHYATPAEREEFIATMQRRYAPKMEPAQAQGRRLKL